MIFRIFAVDLTNGNSVERDQSMLNKKTAKKKLFEIYQPKGLRSVAMSSRFKMFIMM